MHQPNISPFTRAQNTNCPTHCSRYGWNYFSNIIWLSTSILRSFPCFLTKKLLLTCVCMKWNRDMVPKCRSRICPPQLGCSRKCITLNSTHYLCTYVYTNQSWKASLLRLLQPACINTVTTVIFLIHMSFRYPLSLHLFEHEESHNTAGDWRSLNQMYGFVFPHKLLEIDIE